MTGKQEERIVTSGGKVVKSAVDFCKNCFDRIGRLHATHHFVNSDVNSVYQEFTWQCAINPRAPSAISKFPPELLASMQGREFTAGDYDLLMALDEKRTRAPPLYDILVESLSEIQSDLIENKSMISLKTHLCQICKLPSPPNDVIVVPTDPVTLAIADLKGVACRVTAEQQGCVKRVLPCCRTIVHTACIMNVIKSTLNKESQGNGNETDESCVDITTGAGCLLDKLICQNMECRKFIFGRLSRKRKKKIQLDVVESSVAKDQEVNSLNLGFGVAGTAMLSAANSEDISRPSNGGTDSITSAPRRPMVIRSSSGRRVTSAIADENAANRNDPTAAEIALNSLTMSLSGTSTTLSTRQHPAMSRKPLKGLSLSSGAAIKRENMATLQEGPLIDSDKDLYRAPLGNTNRTVSRQVGGNERTKPVVRQQLNRCGSFSNGLPPRNRSNSSCDQAASELVNLVVRSVTADTNSHSELNGDVSIGLTNQNSIAAPNESTRSHRFSGLSFGNTKNSSVARLAKGSLVRSNRLRRVSDRTENEHGLVQLSLNVNHCI